MEFVELSDIEIEIMGVHMVLLPQKAIYVPDRKELLIADLHLGKVEHFRKNGIGVPGDISGKDIDILHDLISIYSPQKVVFLGDLFHSDYNNSWDRLVNMISDFNDIEFYLVVGNHDILEEAKYSELHLCQEYHIDNIICTHEPYDVTIGEKYNLCGHIHPGVRLTGKGKQYMKLPCFYFGVKRAIMPAFGTFTGTHTLKPTSEDKVYVIANETVSRVH